MTTRRSAIRRSSKENVSRRSERPQGAKRSCFTATEAKNEFGRLLERAIQGETVVITKHGTPKAVLISIDEYKARSPQIELDALTAEFDAMLERMQTAEARKAVDDLFSSTPAQLGTAAVNAARKRG